MGDGNITSLHTVNETRDGIPYRWERFHSDDEAALAQVRLTDLETGVMMTTNSPNPKKRAAAHRGWAMARHSRAPGNAVEIMAEMAEKGVDPDSKLDSMYTSYGHASPADMAVIPVDVNGVPMHVPLVVFNHEQVNGGQENSTRYQEQFMGNPLQPLRHIVAPEFRDAADELENDYQQIGRASIAKAMQLQQPVREAFLTEFGPVTDRELASLDSRVLDTTRSLLLLGQSTGFGSMTGARQWSELISHLRAMDNTFYQRIGTQLQTLLTMSPELERSLDYKAEAPTLIRHTEPDARGKIAIKRVQSWAYELNRVPDSNHNLLEHLLDVQSVNDSPADIIAVNYLTAAFPGTSFENARKEIKKMTRDERVELGHAIFDGHDNYRHVPNLANAAAHTFVIEGSLGEVRDWNRHRPWGRTIQGLPNLPSPAFTSADAQAVLQQGYVLPLYVLEPQLSTVKREMRDTLEQHYEQSAELLHRATTLLGADADHTWILGLLPLAHRAQMLMSGVAKQAHYMTWQRVRNGGHINYRWQANEMNRLFAESDPLFAATRVPGEFQIVEPLDRASFLDRS